jgi:threonine dehydrogenase-like Zn-dependent dehydrogenase
LLWVNRHPGIVEEVGSAVTSVKPGQFVIGSFATSDNTCPHSTRPGGSVGYVGVPYEAELDFISPGGSGGLFFSHVRRHGGAAPVRRFLPELVELVWNRKINRGKVSDLTLPLEEVAEGYRAMDERRAIKALLRP